jgi:Domain of unknown function (DUF2382)
LEERLNIGYQRRKIGEVTVRKVVATRIVEVPVRYEKLVIEQVNPQQKTLAEVDLSQEQSDTVERVGETISGRPVVMGDFKSSTTASHVLDAIAKTLGSRCKNIRIEVELEDDRLQKAYQDWLNRCSQI